MFEPGKLADLISRKASPDPFMLESLIAWLRTKDGAEQYPWVNIRKCVMAQFRDYVAWKGSYTSLLGEMGVSDPVKFECAVTAPLPHTFGAALLRARAYQAAQS